MSLSRTGGNTRATVFAPRIDALLRTYRGSDLFRLEDDTIGVAGVDLMDSLLLSRPANDEERPTFKPVQGRSVPRTDASALMQAVSADVRAALKKPLGDSVDLTGKWPHVAHVYLRDLVFGRESFRFRVLVDRRLELTPKLTWMAVAAGTAMLGKPGTEIPLSNLAARVLNAETYDDRRYAMYLYRRVAAPVCFTVSALVTNALWLGSPFDEGVPNRDILLEALRLLPPSWNILRMASPEYLAVDDRIGPKDDILMLPLLTHRDPRLWDDPDTFRPERWAGLDPDDQPGYLPFGHASERCWGRHMVMPLAERLLDIVRRDGLVVSPQQTVGKVELDGLLEVAGVRMVRR
ncbi:MULTISPECIES: cytochrome P450 [Streptomycetaceae]|uniref:cytochrome P450 n=1 Tax=Streptomycetaceae TaxID=2062 RepID=UPI000CDBC847|nr:MULTISPECIES: cytochrome P450 [Streptomycetaceae]AUY53004.1 cytochrome P450 [Streptomyces sp. CB01881]MBP0448762.1 cytochrome P450 [Kitasatospora sp. RG8]TYC70720.1 cytochrome P450 [Streptomyces sp. CB01881]